MNNREEYLTQLTNAGISPETAEQVADAVVATDEGRDRTPEQQQACFDALMSLADSTED